MKREEKAQSSKERIMKAAMEEFGAKSYDAASLNTICNDNAISKGLVYHYFGNKDELYLCCVQSCFEKFTAFLAEEDYNFSDFQEGMNQYLARRFLFFQRYVQEGRVFFHTVLQTPKHLAAEIEELRGIFDAQCLEYYRDGLDHISLRKGITKESALEYFVIFQEVFNGCFQKYKDENIELNTLIEIHEKRLPQFLNIILYGIAEENRK